MRLHEEPREAQPPSPVPARATAEEFAAAVAALEARGSESGRPEGASSTVDIAEAVRELGLEADPEAVWAEVQNQRARRAGAEARVTRTPAAARKRRRRAGLFAALAALVVVPSGVLIGGRVIGAHHQQQSAAADVGPLTLLSEIPDGVPVYIQGGPLDGLLHGRSPAQTVVSRGGGSDFHWVLVRHDGRVYLRGYATPQVEQPGYLSRLSLYSVETAGELANAPSQPVTIPLNGTQLKDSRGMDNWDEITLTGVQTDGHFHDKW